MSSTFETAGIVAPPTQSITNTEMSSLKPSTLPAVALTLNLNSLVDSPEMDGIVILIEVVHEFTLTGVTPSELL